MQVTVKLFASFREGRVPIQTCEFPPGTTVRDVALQKGIPLAEIGIMLVNCRHVALDRELVEGDLLAIFPLLGGG